MVGKEVVPSPVVVFCQLPALQFRIYGEGSLVRKEVVPSPEVVFCQLPALQFQIPGRRGQSEERGRLLLRGCLLSITCSPVPDSWEEVVG